MSQYNETSKAVDIILQMLAFGTLVGVGLAAPNAIQMLDKPLGQFFDKMDDREKQRKLSKLRSYMKTQGLVRGDYDHGFVLTKKALKRLEKIEYENMQIAQPKKWDKMWRIIIFDIPESKRAARVGFTNKIRSLGYQLLQQSVWIYPYDSEEIIMKTAQHFDIEEWLTYLETSKIANQEKLIKRFSSLKLV